MITLYDLGPFASPDHPSLSPHTRKTRYTLDYKKIPHKVSWVHFFTMEETAKRIGAPPTGVRADGSPKYTVPFIYDDTTGVAISESLLIAEYIDKTYPDTPRVVPDGTRALQAVFADTVAAKIIVPWYGVLIPHLVRFTTPVLREGGIKIYGPPPELTPEQIKSAWEAGKAGLNDIGKWYADHGGMFLTGDRPIYADFTLVTWFRYVKIVLGSEDERWKELESLHGSRWKEMLEEVEKYESAEIV
ncbi:hypothetical protein E1B28_007097 [Marasmius oreades]|uniref:GST N-terminal domain-containing protein n=1 Tax=Marasmius oreades TaxID=181124 RepID=A0A9P7S1N1_9AGAR|nr:uncharacterized protein E1B28_007097 [Marasmius oreades]KAG7093415.1 hypothetical protein E1B28_007097 [Marasmius oreades]